MLRLRHLSILLLASMMACTTMTAAAQDDDTSNLGDLSQFDGIESSISRGWSVDFEAMAAITPEDENADPFADMEGIFFLMAMVSKFDNDDHAHDAYQAYLDNATDEISGSFSDDDEPTYELSEADIEDIGDEAHSFDAHSTLDDSEGFYRYSFARKDQYLFIIVNVGSTQEDAAKADDLLAAMVNDGEESGDDVEFIAEGGSTGGLWGFFPDDDFDVLQGLVPSGDQVLYPVTEEG